MMRLIAAASFCLVVTSFVSAGDWGSWRGPSSNGISTETDLPKSWSKEKNVACSRTRRLMPPSNKAATCVRRAAAHQSGGGLLRKEIMNETSGADRTLISSATARSSEYDDDRLKRAPNVIQTDSWPRISMLES